MISKGNDSEDPSQYRPITCLPTIYKILTSIISTKITTHLEYNNIIAEEQKGCRRGHMGCKEQLIIDSIIHRQAIAKNRNLHCTYIDYRKAFDSIPHPWLLRILEIYKINSKLIDFLTQILPSWKTNLHIRSGCNPVVTREIAVRKGIFQGDSLSPLWFCLALNPLSSLLNKLNTGYSLQNGKKETTISHLIYMDDIKLYASTQKDMKLLIDFTAQFSKDINMQFGLEKRKTLNIKKGKIEPGDQAQEGDIISSMEPDDVYKYLGYQQAKQLDHTKLNKSLITEYIRRVSTICKSQLTGKYL